MIFCEKEILLYICDNLTNQSAETITNSKTVSTEEAEAKYERVLLASLQGYSLYLAKVPTEHIKKSEELNMQIISHHNFWKLSKHKTMAVQAAFFGVISAVGQKAPFLFETQKPLVVTTVFSNLDKSDPTVLPKIWECLLLITANIEVSIKTKIITLVNIILVTGKPVGFNCYLFLTICEIINGMFLSRSTLELCKSKWSGQMKYINLVVLNNG